MFENFRRWYLRNYTEITWFLIGFLVMDGLVAFGNHNYGDALLSWGLAAVNYFFARR